MGGPAAAAGAVELLVPPPADWIEVLPHATTNVTFGLTLLNSAAQEVLPRSQVSTAACAWWVP